MSIITRKIFYVSETPTDVTTFTIGVVRADNGATVTAAGTAMTHTSTGHYEHTFEEPAAGLTYTATFTVVYGGATTQWTESLTGSTTEAIPMPALTGDTLVDTYNALCCERLRLARNGPHPSYIVHGHKFDWNAYLDILEKRIAALRKEIAQSDPFDEIGIGV